MNATAVTLRDWLWRIGPMIALKIPFFGWRPGKPRIEVRGEPRIEIDAHAPPDLDTVERMRRAEGKDRDTP